LLTSAMALTIENIDALDTIDLKAQARLSLGQATLENSLLSVGYKLSTPRIALVA
jgi:hypothetical protein